MYVLKVETLEGIKSLHFWNMHRNLMFAIKQYPGNTDTEYCISFTVVIKVCDLA